MSPWTNNICYLSHQYIILDEWATVALVSQHVCLLLYVTNDCCNATIVAYSISHSRPLIELLDESGPFWLVNWYIYILLYLPSLHLSFPWQVIAFISLGPLWASSQTHLNVSTCQFIQLDYQASIYMCSMWCPDVWLHAHVIICCTNSVLSLWELHIF